MEARHGPRRPRARQHNAAIPIHAAPRRSSPSTPRQRRHPRRRRTQSGGADDGRRGTSSRPPPPQAATQRQRELGRIVPSVGDPDARCLRRANQRQVASLARPSSRRPIPPSIRPTLSIPSRRSHGVRGLPLGRGTGDNFVLPSGGYGRSNPTGTIGEPFSASANAYEMNNIDTYGNNSIYGDSTWRFTSSEIDIPPFDNDLGNIDPDIKSNMPASYMGNYTVNNNQTSRGITS